ncbi:MAG: D-alanine--D-alanine ligase [Calditrichaeota bacterium]|nr:D-alanine--D-alanine ligase [Calditrichota bacterium]
MNRITLAILFGGRSVEHEVSIITGFQALEAARRENYDLLPVYLGRDNVWYVGEAMADIAFFRVDHPALSRLTQVLPAPDATVGKLRLIEAHAPTLRARRVWTIDCVLPATHGTFGEDGSLQGLLDMAGVPYAGSDVAGSSAGMDKITTKALLGEAGLPTLPGVIIDRRERDAESGITSGQTEALGEYPYFVKPARLGSSVGVSLVQDRDTLKRALDLAFRFGSRVLVEPALRDAAEVNCSVVDGDPPVASEIEQVVKEHPLLSFEDKYKGGSKGKGGKSGEGMAGQKRIIPAPLPDELADKVRDLAVRTFLATGAGGVARIDFLIAPGGAIYINEINNIPGSFAYYLWEPRGKSFADLIDRLVERAYEIRKRRDRTLFTFDGNLLAGGS